MCSRGRWPICQLPVSWGRGPASCGYFLSTHTWIHSYLHRADSNQDSKMSFKEIKSLLRMVNVDMNDMYAYRLFKVGTCRHSDLCSPSHGSPQFPSPAPPTPQAFVESGLFLQKGCMWALVYPFTQGSH